MKYEIDAKGKSLGRIATEVATVLLGKNTPHFEKHVVADVSIVVTNAKEMSLSEKKKDQKIYTHYTGYPGGLKKERLGHLIERRGAKEALYRAVYGMLPGNKLRDKRLKNLTITD